MKRVLISELKNHIGESVVISGWVHKIRVLKNVTFLILRDRTGLVQCVIEKGVEVNDSIKNEWVISIAGTVKESKNSLNNFEVVTNEVNVLNKTLGELPIEVNKEDLDVSIESLFNYRVLSLRNEKKSVILKVSALIAEGFREYLISCGFMEIFTPKISLEGAEGGTELFKVDYFGESAFLCQSPQFYKQMMVAAGFERVFEVGSFFRAEKHDTNRHLNQFTSLDLEMGFIEDENDIMDLEEDLLRHIIEKLNNEGQRFFNILNVSVPDIPKFIPRFELSEVSSILKSEYGKEVNDDLDFQSEKLLGKYVREKYNSDFVFVYNYSREKKPMYIMPKGESGTRSFDLIYKGMEITSGGQRIHDYNMLIESFKYKNLDVNNFKSYIETFKYGVPPHGGLAIGLERLTSLFLEIHNIREATTFPRDRNRIIP